MKQIVKLNEQELNMLVTEATKQYLRESVDYKDNLNEDIDEGMLGMIGGAIARPYIKKVIDMLVDTLHLRKDSFLYRVFTSRLFAIALGNELQNVRKNYKKNGGPNPMSDMGGLFGVWPMMRGMYGRGRGRNRGGFDYYDFMRMYGNNGNNKSGFEGIDFSSTPGESDDTRTR